MAGFTGAGVGAGMIFLNFSPAAHYVVVALLSAVLILLSQKFVINDKPATGEEGGLVLRKPDALLLRVGLISFLGMMAEGCMFDWSGVYFKKIVEYLIKLGAAIVLGLGYTIKGKPQQFWPIVKFRIDTLKGLIGL